jgi:hypothetical protein
MVLKTQFASKSPRELFKTDCWEWRVGKGQEGNGELWVKGHKVSVRQDYVLGIIQQVDNS